MPINLEIKPAANPHECRAGVDFNALALISLVAELTNLY